jgi:hypothetical protein
MKPMNSRKSLLFLACALSLSLLACRQPASGLSSGNGQAAKAHTSGARLAWTQFTDPFEQAFSLQVPQGWTVQGGLFRVGFSDQRTMVSIKSPDGQIEIRFGDISVPTYTPPNPYHVREGEPYDLGAQAQMVVEHYRSGPDYAVMYAHSRFATVCRNPQAPSTVVDFSFPDALEVKGDRVSPGQIEYLCQTDAGPRVALVYAKTVMAGPIWQVPTLVSLLAPPDRLDYALSVTHQSAQTFRLSQQWMAYQQQMNAQGMEYQRWRQAQRRTQIGEQIKQFEGQMAAMQNQVNAFEHHQRMSIEQGDEFSNALNGLTPTTDPLTGENRTVWTGTQDHYWANGLGQVVNSHDSPSPAFHQLQTPQ